jgi:hypothetical protein
MNRVVYALVALGFVMLGPEQVHASIVLPAAVTGAGCVNNLATPSSTQGATSCTIAGAAAQVSLDPAVQLTATSLAAGLETVGASAGALYSFEIVGPSTTFVPIIIDTILSTAVSGYAGSSASITINTVPSNLVTPAYNARVTACQNNTSPFACTGDPAAFDGAIHLTAISNLPEPGQLDLFVLTGAALGGFASASADPLITIDPSFPGAADFSLVLSDGVGNGLPTVPEPPTWTMIVVGISGLAAMIRARRRQLRQT